MPRAERIVEVIPATWNPTDESSREIRKLRVAAYCRVSTELEQQQSSYDIQIEYYTRRFPEQLHKGNVYISLAETAGDMGQDTQAVAVYDDECAVLAGKVHVYMVNAADPYLPASQGFAPHRVSAPV